MSEETNKEVASEVQSDAQEQYDNMSMADKMEAVSQKDSRSTSTEELVEQFDPEKEAAKRPEWLPEKFQSAEDMAKAYQELESKLGGDTHEDGDGKQHTDETIEHTGEIKQNEEIETKSEESSEEVETEASEEVVSTKETFEKFVAEVQEQGELSENSYKELQEKHHLPKEIVDNYIALSKQHQESVLNSFYDSVGGQEKYDNVSKWASENLNDAELSAYNEVVARNNPAEIKIAFDGLEARYNKVNATPPAAVHGNKSRSTTDIFKSEAELAKAMQDPRYAYDNKYMTYVKEKLARSKNL